MRIEVDLYNDRDELLITISSEKPFTAIEVSGPKAESMKHWLPDSYLKHTEPFDRVYKKNIPEYLAFMFHMNNVYYNYTEARMVE